MPTSPDWSSISEGRAVLLVLDNCEHLIAAVARAAHEVLESCPGVRMWATSREGLAVPGEVLWPVPPLALDDAVTLFLERGLAADPATNINDKSPVMQHTLADICARLDGLPSRSSSRPPGSARCRSMSSRKGSRTDSGC